MGALYSSSQELRDYIGDLWLNGDVPANLVSNLAGFITRAGAGAASAVKDLHTVGGGGNASRKLSTAFGVRSEGEFMYQVEVPLSSGAGVRHKTQPIS